MNQYELVLNIIKNTLNTLSRVVEKAERLSKEKGMADQDFFNLRLAPDMLPFVSQVRIATDDARRNLFLLAGKEHVKMSDDETTFAALKDRISKTKDLVDTLTVEDFKDADDRHVSLYWMGETYILGKDFINEFAIQNTLFHVVTAYDIVRNQGGNIGKTDFIGEMSIHQA